MNSAHPERPIRLLILIHDLAPFGAQRVALNTVRFLDKKTFTVTVCSFGGDRTLTEEFRKCGAEVVALGARRYLDPAAWRRLVSLIRGFRPDLIQTNMPELSVPVRLLALFLPGTSVIHTIQNPFSSEPWYWRSLNRLTFSLCGRVVLCSERMKEGAGRWGDKFTVIHNGMELDPASREPGARAGLGIKQGEKVICCIARLSRQKGQDVLLKAFSLLADRSVRLLLVGDGEDAEDLKLLARELGVAEKVSFLGRRAETAAILAASDIYAAPSRWEGLGLSLGEAMLAGIPCVGTAIPGHADILKDGITGIAVPPEDPRALAAGIARLLDDMSEAGRFAAAARNLVKAGFTVESMAKKYENIYLGLAGGARA